MLSSPPSTTPSAVNSAQKASRLVLGSTFALFLVFSIELTSFDSFHHIEEAILLYAAAGCGCRTVSHLAFRPRDNSPSPEH